MIENKMTIGQMIDHLGLSASLDPQYGLVLSSGDAKVHSSAEWNNLSVTWKGKWLPFNSPPFNSFEDALRWMCEKKDNDFQIDAFEIYPDRSLRIYVHCGTGPKRFEGNFILSRAESPEWLPVEFKGTPRPTDEQFDDLVRDHEILGLICEQMWGIPPKEEA